MKCVWDHKLSFGSITYIIIHEYTRWESEFQLCHVIVDSVSLYPFFSFFSGVFFYCSCLAFVLYSHLFHIYLVSMLLLLEPSLKCISHRTTTIAVQHQWQLLPSATNINIYNTFGAHFSSFSLSILCWSFEGAAAILFICMVFYSVSVFLFVWMFSICVFILWCSTELNSKKM